jgi:hypothetical protein
LESLKGRYYLEDLIIDGKIILKWDLREIVLEGMDWINLTQDCNWWQTLVNAVINIWVPQKAGNFLTS